MRKFLAVLAVLGAGLFYLRTHYFVIDILDYTRTHKDSVFASATVEYYVGLSYYMREMYEPATRCFNQVLTDFPNSRYGEQASYKLAASYEELRDWPNAKQAYEKYFELYPAGKDIMVARGRYDHIKFN